MIRKAREDSKIDLFGVGEFFTNDVGELIEYLDKFEGTISLFDTPFVPRLQTKEIAENRAGCITIFKQLVTVEQTMTCARSLMAH